MILLANHQTEADPQILRLILEEQDKTSLAEKVIYVAGHKVRFNEQYIASVLFPPPFPFFPFLILHPAG